MVCIDSGDYPAGLERGKIYRILPDPEAAGQGFRRVIDESGEDYLYPADLSEPIRLSPRLRSML